MEEKSSEITAIPELLDKIHVKGQVVTIDAMGTQTAIAEKIRKKRADYVLALNLKVLELFRPNLSMKKKRFIISMNPPEFLETVLAF